MKNKKTLKAKITKTVTKNINGKPAGGYIEITVQYGKNWKRIYLPIED